MHSVQSLFISVLLLCWAAQTSQDNSSDQSAALDLFQKYKSVAEKDAKNTGKNVWETLETSAAKVQTLYGNAESRLLANVRSAVDDQSSDEAKLLLTIEIPASIVRVNKAVDRAIIKIKTIVMGTLKRIHDILSRTETSIEESIRSGCGATEVARIIGCAADDVKTQLKQAQSQVQIRFFWANLIVQAYIALVERHVKEHVPDISPKVNQDLMDDSVLIDNVEKKAMASIATELKELIAAIRELCK